MKAVVVSEPNFLAAGIPGGVQVCTREFLELVRVAGYDVQVHPVTTSPSLAARLRIRLGIDVYDRYDVSAHAPAIAREAAAGGASLVLLNQVEMLPLAKPLRALLPSETLLAVLSHGNGSGDFVHDTIRPGHAGAGRMRDAWKLGAMLAAEAGYYRAGDVDLVVCVSDTEREIDRWLGAGHVLVVPRTFHPDFIEWAPVRGRVGFVGTLDHLPNFTGLERLAEALAAEAPADLQLRVVGGGKAQGQTLMRRFPFLRWVGRLDDEALRVEAATWQLFANPIFWYARGTSMKLATAINWGIPVVTTPAGRRGYEWRDGDLPQPGEPPDMARTIAALLCDEQRLRELQSEVRRVARSGPAMADIASRFQSELIAARARRARQNES